MQDWFNLEVTEIVKAYNHGLGLLEKLGLLVSEGTGSSELRIHVSQTVGRSLTDEIRRRHLCYCKYITRRFAHFVGFFQ